MHNVFCFRAYNSRGFCVFFPLDWLISELWHCINIRYWIYLYIIYILYFYIALNHHGSKQALLTTVNAWHTK